MDEIATTLLATDGSQQANDALVTGLAVIGAARPLVLVTVVEPTDPSLVVGGGHAGPVMTPDDKQRWLRDRDAAGRQVLDEALAALRRDDVEAIVLEGDPGREICRFAETGRVGLIVLATTGRGGLKRAMLGSVSDHVVRNAPCPVLTVGPAATEPGVGGRS